MHWQALQYVAGTNNTVPFDRTPAVVSKALNLIKSRASIICENDTEFNEILTVAYMEGQKMNVSCLCNLLRLWICLYVQSITPIAKRVWALSFLLYLLELLHGCISAYAVRSQGNEDWGNSVYHFSMWADRWNLEIVILMLLTGWRSHHGGCRNSKCVWGTPVVVLLSFRTFKYILAYRWPIGLPLCRDGSSYWPKQLCITYTLLIFLYGQRYPWPSPCHYQAYT